MYKQQLKTYLYNISLETINQHLKSKKNNLFINNFKKSINKKLIYLNQNKINKCLDLKGFKILSGFFFKDSVLCLLSKLIFNIQINKHSHSYCICFCCGGQ